MQYYHHITDEETKTQRSYTLAPGYSQYSVGSWDPKCMKKTSAIRL